MPARTALAAASPARRPSSAPRLRPGRPGRAGRHGGRWAAAAAILTASCAGLAACGGSSVPQPAPTPPPAAGQPVTLNNSVASYGATWAVVVMGGSSATLNNFWQLFVRPSGASGWNLVTPPGVADNGGLVLAGASGVSGDVWGPGVPGSPAGPAGPGKQSGQPATVGFRPSLQLTFTPFTWSPDHGQTWTSANPIYGVVANVPDAIAQKPWSTSLLVLLSDGTVRAGSPLKTSWTTVATAKSLARTPAGRQCGLANLTGTAYTPSGTGLLAGTCTRPGVVGIFSPGRAPGTWALAGPALPGALAGQPFTVLAINQFPLTTKDTATAKAGPAANLAAVLEVGPPKSASLVTIWSSDNAAHWQVSVPYPLPAAAAGPAAVSFGPAGLAAVVLSGGTRGVAISGPTSSWQALPALPAGTEALAAGPGGSIQALAVKHSVLTVWQAGPGVTATAWTKVQTINVPIQYGSSG